METVINEQSPEAIWNEVAAERTGDTPAPVKTPAPAQEPVPAPAAIETPVVEEAKPDPLAEIATQLKDLQEKFNSRMRNVEGHIGNLNGTQKEMKTLMEASKAAATQVSDAPTQAEMKGAVGTTEWDELKEQYPEWAKATESLVIANRGQSFDAKAFEATIKDQVRGETEAVRREIIDVALDAVFPGWKTEVQSDGFKAWAGAQPDAVKALMQSDQVGDAAKMLKLYDAARQVDPAAQIVEARKQKLAAAVGAPKGVQTPNVTKSWSDMSEQERWEYEKRQRAKRASR